LAGKVRIFELAKELGLTSKELTALFNERLGGAFEAKNQLSVVPDPIADLVRSVLLKPGEKPAAAAPKAAAASAPTKPATTPKAPPAKAAPAPVQRLRPVVGTSTRAPAQAAPAAPAAPVASIAPPPATEPRPARAAPEAIPQLRPVPSGQTSIARRPSPPPLRFEL
jgi:translation initiation factor IF-2